MLWLLFSVSFEDIGFFSQFQLSYDGGGRGVLFWELVINKVEYIQKKYGERQKILKGAKMFYWL